MKTVRSARNRSRLQALSSAWRFFFAVDLKPPRTYLEVRRRRFRASFFFLLGVVAALLIQALSGR